MKYQNLEYLQAVLFVRKSHLRNLIYRPILQLSSRIQQSRQHAEQGIRIAKEAIHVLTELTEHTTFIQKHALFFKHLVLTAFGNLLLAVVNATSLFWDSVRTEFDAALNLIRLLSTKSMPLLRLWQRLEGLRNLQTKLLPDSNATTTNTGSPERNNHSLHGLSLEELFPPVTSGTTPMEPAGAYNLVMDDAGMREHLNSLFDVSGGFDNAFDFPYVEWDPSA